MSGNTFVRASIDKDIKNEAAAVLAGIGLTVSDAFRIMLTRTATEKALPFEPLVPNDEPNDETIAAMLDARQGKMESFNSIEEFIDDLNAQN